MTFNVDPRDITRIKVIPWELEERLYGVAYETKVGIQHTARIGSKAEAKAIVDEVMKAHSAPTDNVVNICGND